MSGVTKGNECPECGGTVMTERHPVTGEPDGGVFDESQIRCVCGHILHKHVAFRSRMPCAYLKKGELMSDPDHVCGCRDFEEADG